MFQLLVTSQAQGVSITNNFSNIAPTSRLIIKNAAMEQHSGRYKCFSDDLASNTVNVHINSTEGNAFIVTAFLFIDIQTFNIGIERHALYNKI